MSTSPFFDAPSGGQRGLLPSGGQEPKLLHPLGPADEPLTIEWPEGHSIAVVATAFHGGAVLGPAATEDKAWAIYDQWPKTDCR